MDVNDFGLHVAFQWLVRHYFGFVTQSDGSGCGMATLNSWIRNNGLLFYALFYFSCLEIVMNAAQMSLGYGYANFNSHAQAGALI